MEENNIKGDIDFQAQDLSFQSIQSNQPGKAPNIRLAKQCQNTVP
jgi:hypothetical protein